MTYRWRRQREPSGASVTPALVTSTIVTGTTSAGVTSGALDTTGATLLVVALARAGALDNVVSDSKGNTWTPATAFGTDPIMRFFYVASPTVGAGHTFTLGPATSTFALLGVMAFSGTKATLPFDVENGAAQGAASTTLQTGSVTPSLAGSLIVSAFGFGTSPATPLLINAGFTIAQQTEESATSFGGGLAYLVQGTAAAVNPTWTRTNSSARSSALIAAFKKGP